MNLIRDYSKAESREQTLFCELYPGTAFRRRGALYLKKSETRAKLIQWSSGRLPTEPTVHLIRWNDAVEPAAKPSPVSRGPSVSTEWPLRGRN